MRSYKIIGGDGREYGPVDLDELQEWIRDGRVGRSTLIWRDDLASWNPAARYAEIAGEIQSLPGGEVQPPQNFELVGFWPRLGAYLMDMLLLSVVFAIISIPWRDQIQQAQKEMFSASFGIDMDKTIQVLMRLGIIWTVQSLLSMTYYVCMNGKLGASVGKLIIGARIVNLDGSPIGFGRAFLRYCYEVLSYIPVGIGYLMIGFREDRRGLHDLLAKTQVIYKRHDEPPQG